MSQRYKKRQQVYMTTRQQVFFRGIRGAEGIEG